ncbi:hypothetical protein HID58_038281 [Brassica napus]|uniref:Uncharacterized protein n=1 Tax=Brassica napus TaxID=3708 RepID=A0ABQ8BNQ7_BRANA|nr:hypothetical protein HID58_038281 [Brassica napus]
MERFPFQLFKDFETNCGFRDDLYALTSLHVTYFASKISDVVQLINGHSITDRSVLHGVGVATTQRVLVHLQPKE